MNSVTLDLSLVVDYRPFPYYTVSDSLEIGMKYVLRTKESYNVYNYRNMIYKAVIEMNLILDVLLDKDFRAFHLNTKLLMQCYGSC